MNDIVLSARNYRYHIVIDIATNLCHNYMQLDFLLHEFTGYMQAHAISLFDFFEIICTFFFVMMLINQLILFAFSVRVYVCACRECNCCMLQLMLMPHSPLLTRSTFFFSLSICLSHISPVFFSACFYTYALCKIAPPTSAHLPLSCLLISIMFLLFCFAPSLCF